MLDPLELSRLYSVHTGYAFSMYAGWVHDTVGLSIPLRQCSEQNDAQLLCERLFSIQISGSRSRSGIGFKTLLSDRCASKQQGYPDGYMRLNIKWPEKVFANMSSAIAYTWNWINWQVFL